MANRQNIDDILKLFGDLQSLDQPEQLVMPILLEAGLLVDAYRHVRRHDIPHLAELTRHVDALMRELEIIRRTKQWDEEGAKAPAG